MVVVANGPQSCGGQSSTLGLWVSEKPSPPAQPGKWHFSPLILVSKLQLLQSCEGHGLEKARLLHQTYTKDRREVVLWLK